MKFNKRLTKSIVRNISSFFTNFQYKEFQNMLDSGNDFYIKLYIKKLYLLNSGDIMLPIFIKHLLTEGLIDVYKRLRKKEDNDYFKILIFEKNFMNSQIVYSRESQNYYKNIFRSKEKFYFTSFSKKLASDMVRKGFLIEYLEFIDRDSNYQENVVCISLPTSPHN